MAEASSLHQRICAADGCIDFGPSNGFCPPHYQEYLGDTRLPGRLIPRSGTCLVPVCDGPRSRSGLCAPHYNGSRSRDHCPACGALKLRRSALCAACHLAAVAAALPTEKLCRQCSRTLPMRSFDLRKTSQGAAKWRSNCRECEGADQRSRAAFRAKAGIARDRSGDRAGVPYLGLRKYAKDLGIPWAQVVERYPADNRCEICKRTPKEAYPSGRFVRLSLDHDHETGKLRGFLCGPCNTALGQLGDNRARIRKAMDYLRRFEKMIAPEPDPIPTLF